jgi:hypothetical protein
MDGNAQTVAFEVDELLGADHTRLDIPLTSKTPQGEIVDPAMDNASPGNIVALQDKANELINAQQAQIKSLAAVLATPKAALTPKTTLPATSLITQLRAAAGS